MKKIILIAIALINSQYNCNAQQQPQFTHYMYNTIAVNPGYTGSRDALAINAVNRNQWVGFDDEVPRTTTISVHSPLRNENMGLGISVMHDQSGYENFSYVYADYSYTIKVKEDHHLAFGVKAGFSQYKIDPELFTYQDVLNDPYFQDQLNRWTPNVGVGMYYHTNKWYAGLSSPRILNNDYNKDSDYVALEQNHYYLIGGYVFDMSPNTKFRPSFSTKYTSGAPLSVEGSAVFLFYEKFWLGASYRVDDAVGALFDFKLNKQFRIGYAFEYPVTDIARYTSGTHEVMLIYEFKYNNSRYKSPRYF